MSTAPGRIWLQRDDVTWCEDKINESDTEYVRADLAVMWRYAVDELPQEAQEVLFVRNGKTVHGAWVGGTFWHSNVKTEAEKWMPLPVPNAEITGG